VVTEAAGPKGRFFDRPGGDKKESKRFDQSETKKKKGLYVPLDKKVGCFSCVGVLKPNHIHSSCQAG